MIPLIRKTRIKFALIIVLSLISLLGALLFNLNMTMNRTKYRNINEVLDVLVMDFGNETSSMIANNSEYFIIKVNNSHNIVDVVFGQQPLTKDQVILFKDEVIPQEQKRGEINGYRYLIREISDGQIIAFVNAETENIMLSELRDTSMNIAIVGIFVIVLLGYVLSRLITKPLEMAVEKQKSFVSEASHELKTPLSIIKINSTLLKNNPLDVEHLDEIDIQVERMSSLVNDLMVLAKLESYIEEEERSEFDLSKSILRSVLQLETLSYEHNKAIIYDIQDHIMYKGIQKDIVTMMDALIDNAIKHSSAKSDILVEFKGEGKDKVLKVSNQSPIMTEEECRHIFDGFYRLDQTRASNSKGFGIGLSMVKNIVEKQGGTVNATYGDGLFTITIYL